MQRGPDAERVVDTPLCPGKVDGRPIRQVQDGLGHNRLRREVGVGIDGRVGFLHFHRRAVLVHAHDRRIRLSVTTQEARRIAGNEAHRRLHDRLEHRPRVGRRLADYAENVGACRLARHSLLRLVEKAHVFKRGAQGGRYRGEQAQFGFAEGVFALIICGADHAQHAVAADDRNMGRRLAGFGAWKRRRVHILAVGRRVENDGPAGTANGLEDAARGRRLRRNLHALAGVERVEIVDQVGLVVIPVNVQVRHREDVPQLVTHQVDDGLEIQFGRQPLLDRVDDLQFVDALLQLCGKCSRCRGDRVLLLPDLLGFWFGCSRGRARSRRLFYRALGGRGAGGLFGFDDHRRSINGSGIAQQQALETVGLWEFECDRMVGADAAPSGADGNHPG